MYTLTEAQEALRLPSHKLIQDVETCWGSTYDMLKRIVEQQQPLCNMLVASKRKDLDLSDKEVTIIENIIQILEPMKKVTKLFSGETYVTLSGVLPAIRYIKGLLDEKKTSEKLSR